MILGMSTTATATTTTNTTVTALVAAQDEPETVETVSFHQELKKRFIEGDHYLCLSY